MRRKQSRRPQKPAAAKPPQVIDAVQRLFAEGFRLHQAGRSNEAEAIYRTVLSTDAGHAECLHLLGVVLYQQARPELAVGMIRRAVTLNALAAVHHYSNLGNALHGAGRFDEAAASYRKAIAIKADYADAHSNLGVTLKELGHLSDATESFHRALELNGDSAEIYNNLGNVLKDRGCLEPAVGCYRRAAQLKPDYALAHYNLAIALEELGRAGDAVQSCDRALILTPEDAAAHNNRGLAFAAARRFDLAIGSFMKALEVRGSYPEAFHNLGNALNDSGRPGKALAAFRTAIALRPDYVEAHNNFGEILRRRERMDEAVQVFERAVVLLPDGVEPRNNLGLALQSLLRFDEATAVFREVLARRPLYAEGLSNFAQLQMDLGFMDRAVVFCRTALALQPDLVGAVANFGKACQVVGRLSEALAWHQRAMRLDPERRELRVNNAHTLFCLGRLQEAWRDYEFRKLPLREDQGPAWDGQPALDKTVLLSREQGVADQILAAGMIPDAAALAGALVVECDPRLVGLFSQSFPEVTVIPDMVPPHPFRDAADYQIPMFSLGRYFRRRLEDFPRHHGYLRADPARIAYWRAWLNSLGPGPKFGISWRSMTIDERLFFLPSLDQLAPVFAIPGITWISLQYGRAEDEVDRLYQRTGHRLHIPQGLDLTNDIGDVAALVAALDAVAGTTSAVAILAGALGQPALVYMYYPGYNENRMMGQEHVPWLPTMETIVYGAGKDLNDLSAEFADLLARYVARFQFK